MKTRLSVILLFSMTLMNAQQAPKPTVDVRGEGIIQVVPDMASVTVQVENSGEDARKVQKNTDNTVQEVLKFLRKSGIDQKHIRTQHMQLGKNYDYQTKTYSYVANQTLVIKITDLSDYPDVMNGLLDTGINRIQGISFDSSKWDALEREARIKAIENGKMKAELYAATLGQKIGKAMHISEFQPYQSPTPMYRSMVASAPPADEMIAPGEMEISVVLNLSFELF